LFFLVEPVFFQSTSLLILLWWQHQN